MEKVIRICELTGRVTEIAKNLTTEQAKALIKELAQKDELADYRRVVK